MQYRVIFTAWELVSGQMTETLGSSRWYSSLEEAQDSQWFQRENAIIVTRKKPASLKINKTESTNAQK